MAAFSILRRKLHADGETDRKHSVNYIKQMFDATKPVFVNEVLFVTFNNYNSHRTEYGQRL